MVDDFNSRSWNLCFTRYDDDDNDQTVKSHKIDLIIS